MQLPKNQLVARLGGRGRGGLRAFLPCGANAQFPKKKKFSKIEKAKKENFEKRKFFARICVRVYMYKLII